MPLSELISILHWNEYRLYFHQDVFINWVTWNLCFSDLPPSQGGRYAGFGNTVERKKEDDFFENTMSSLSSVSFHFYIHVFL